jgi:hypothetical protein
VARVVISGEEVVVEGFRVFIFAISHFLAYFFFSTVFITFNQSYGIIFVFFLFLYIFLFIFIFIFLLIFNYNDIDFWNMIDMSQ